MTCRRTWYHKQSFKATKTKIIWTTPTKSDQTNPLQHFSTKNHRAETDLTTEISWLRAINATILRSIRFNYCFSLQIIIRNFIALHSFQQTWPNIFTQQCSAQNVKQRHFLSNAFQPFPSFSDESTSKLSVPDICDT